MCLYIVNSGVQLPESLRSWYSTLAHSTHLPIPLYHSTQHQHCQMSVHGIFHFSTIVARKISTADSNCRSLPVFIATWRPGNNVWRVVTIRRIWQLCTTLKLKKLRIFWRYFLDNSPSSFSYIFLFTLLQFSSVFFRFYTSSQPNPPKQFSLRHQIVLVWNGAQERAHHAISRHSHSVLPCCAQVTRGKRRIRVR